MTMDLLNSRIRLTSLTGIKEQEGCYSYFYGSQLSDMVLTEAKNYGENNCHRMIIWEFQ